MITLQKTGNFKLIETKHNTKILYLDNSVYAWVEPAGIGEILVVSHKVHKTDCVLSIGKYQIFIAEDEPNMSDQTHLELEVGKDYWQGYLLPTGLPTENHKKARIIPTLEIATREV